MGEAERGDVVPDRGVDGEAGRRATSAARAEIRPRDRAAGDDLASGDGQWRRYGIGDQLGDRGAQRRWKFAADHIAGRGGNRVRSVDEQASVRERRDVGVARGAKPQLGAMVDEASGGLAKPEPEASEKWVGRVGNAVDDGALDAVADLGEAARKLHAHVRRRSEIHRHLVAREPQRASEDVIAERRFVGRRAKRSHERAIQRRGWIWTGVAQRVWGTLRDPVEQQCAGAGWQFAGLRDDRDLAGAIEIHGRHRGQWLAGAIANDERVAEKWVNDDIARDHEVAYGEIHGAKLCTMAPGLAHSGPHEVRRRPGDETRGTAHRRISQCSRQVGEGWVAGGCRKGRGDRSDVWR